MGAVLKKMATERILLLRIRKGVLKFLGRIMRKVGLENLNLKGHIERKRDSGWQS